jgi:DNA (cytosine-5)-methyltransferase 1
MVAHAPNAGGQLAVAFMENQRGELRTSDRADALKHGGGKPGQGYPAVAFNITPSNSNKDFNARASERAQALTAGGNRPSARGGDLIASMAVRRLTPRECERLQGFPDDYTAVIYRGKPAADGPRYKALGNSMAVPVMRWLLERLRQVDQIIGGEP